MAKVEVDSDDLAEVYWMANQYTDSQEWDCWPDDLVGKALEAFERIGELVKGDNT